MLKYFKFSPRGFSNEVTYLRIPDKCVGDAVALAVDYIDAHPGSYFLETTDKVATLPGVALDWAERHVALPAHFWAA